MDRIAGLGARFPSFLSPTDALDPCIGDSGGTKRVHPSLK
jgi:hypothetical protein